MVDITIDGVSWSLSKVEWVSFDQFVKESGWAYQNYSEQDRLTLLKIAYSFIHGEVEENGKSGGSDGDSGGAKHTGTSSIIT